MYVETQDAQTEALIEWVPHPTEHEVLWAPKHFPYKNTDSIKKRASKLKPSMKMIGQFARHQFASENRVRARLALPPRDVNIESSCNRYVENAARNMLIAEGRPALNGKTRTEYGAAVQCMVTQLYRTLENKAVRCWFALNPESREYHGQWCKIQSLEFEDVLTRLEGFDRWYSGHAVKLFLIDPEKPATEKNIKFADPYGCPFGVMNRNGRYYFAQGSISLKRSSIPLPKPGEDPQANQCTWTL